MATLILFMLKSTLVSGILYTWYALALKNRRLHNYNRFFLLFTLYASIQLPLLNFNWSPEYGKAPAIFTTAKVLHTINTAGDIPLRAQNKPSAEINWQAIILGVAAMISLALLATMFTRIARILRIGKQYPVSVKDGITVLQTDLDNAPFSFMNRVFWRANISMDSAGGRMILRHELAHIKQKHTYDKLACHWLTCVFWMNPFYWIIQIELAMVHEFIADEQAIMNNDADIQEEAYPEVLAKMLLQSYHSNGFFKPEHQFFSSPIKRRLIMLQTKNKVRASSLRRAAVLPLIAGSILILAFSPTEVPGNPVTKSDKKLVLVVDAGHGGKDDGCQSGSLIEKELTLKVAKRLMELAPRYNITVQLTRSNDQFLSPEQRVAFSNSIHPDDFISLHIDDQPDTGTGKGTIDIAINNRNAKANESKRLANAIYQNTSVLEWEQKNRLSEKNPYLLRENISAAALIEIGDIKNKNQMQHIENDFKLDALCGRILQGVVEAHKK